MTFLQDLTTEAQAIRSEGGEQLHADLMAMAVGEIQRLTEENARLKRALERELNWKKEKK